MKEINYLKSILLSQLLVESNETLKGSKFYRHSLKGTVNKANTELERAFNKDYEIVYQNSPEIATNVLNKIDDLINKISTSTVDELVLISDLVDKFQDNKEWYKENSSIDFLKID